MLRTSLRLRWIGALAALIVAFVLAACGSGPSGPPAPVETLLVPGEQLNVYKVLSLDRAVDLTVIQGIDDVQWVLGDSTRQVLSLLDREVVLESWSLSQRPLFAVSITWPQGQGINYSSGLTRSLETIIDLKANVMGIGGDNPVQWPLPDGFVDLILASASDVAPTPEPSPTPAPITTPTPRPTATPVPRSDNFFYHPEGQLRWDGPDDRVSSLDEGHCGPPRKIREEYGIPALVVIEDDDAFGGAFGGEYWFRIIVSRKQASGNLSGYYYGDWQIWKDVGAGTLYLINNRHPETAFRYLTYGCV